MKNKTKIWLTTDTHFGHEAIKRFTGRPDNVDAIIMDNIWRNVADEDVLIHLGDFCIGNDAEWHKRFMELGGKKWLVRGNHDNKSNAWYLAHGWDFVGRSITLKAFGHNILFSHIPQYWDGWYDLNIHGHFHTADHRRFEPEMQFRKNGYQKLLAIEHPDINYKPVTLESFVQ